LPREKVFLIFVSHRWLQGQGSTRWPQGDPDDDVGSKYNLIVAAASKCIGMLRDGMSEENVYLWIDFACICQDKLTNTAPGAIPQDILALDYYIQQSDAILTPIVDLDTSWSEKVQICGRGKNIFEAYGAEGWSEYWNRGWCRLEAFCGAALPTKPGLAPFRSGALANRRPHLLYGTLESQSVSRGKIWTLPALSGQYFHRYSPCDGAVSVETDRKLLKLFVGNLQPLVNRLKSEVYDGDKDDEGRPHGFGSMMEQDYTIYKGFYQHGKRHGLGKVTYANGVVFDGEFQNDQRNGTGEEWWPNGTLKYKGMYEDGARKGLGVLYSEDGSVVHQGEFPEPQAVLSPNTEVQETAPESGPDFSATLSRIESTMTNSDSAGGWMQISRSVNLRTRYS